MPIYGPYSGFDFFSAFFCPFDSRNEPEAHTIWLGMSLQLIYSVMLGRWWCWCTISIDTNYRVPRRAACEPPLQIATDFPAAVCPVRPGVPALPLVSNTSLAAPSHGDS